MSQQAIGNFIAQCRENIKITRGALGERLGVSNKKVTGWEEGKALPGAEIYEPLCRVLGVEVSEMLCGKKLKEAEKLERGEKSASAILAVRSMLNVYKFLAYALIVIGAVLAALLPGYVVKPGQKVFVIVAGVVVAAFGITLLVLLNKAIARLEKA